jgi:hypothetical protein
VRKTEGDLWDSFGKCWVVVPVNVGWTTADPADQTSPCGPNPMGAGVAAQLAARVPSAPHFWGMLCYRLREQAGVTCVPQGWIYFPTKSLDAEKPWLSWNAKADVALVERSLAQLAALRLPSRAERAAYGRGAAFDSEEVAIPLVGCGAGRLRPEKIVALMDRYLDDRFVLVHQRPMGEPAHPF